MNRYYRTKHIRGFTLLETLVALSVLAITLGVLYQIFGVSLRNMQHAKDYSYAQMLAESKLAEIGKGIPVREGSYGGDIDEKYSWQMNITPVMKEATGNELVNTYKVRFVITWPANNSTRSIKIDAYRLATGEA